MSTVDVATTDTATVGWRVLRRALTVLGGAAAGTAIAWAISATSASADTPCEESTLTQVSAVERLAGIQPTQQVVRPLSDVVCEVEQVVPVPAVGDLEHTATRAADDLGRRLAGEVRSVPQLPILGDLGQSERSDAHREQGGGGAHESPSLVRPVGGPHETTPLVRPVGEPPAAAQRSAGASASTVDLPTARGGTARTVTAGMTHRGWPAPVPGTPFVPDKPAYALVPAPGSGSTGSAGGVDSPTAAAFWPVTGQRQPTGGRVPSAAEPGALGQPGAMPGVTPD